MNKKAVSPALIITIVLTLIAIIIAFTFIGGEISNFKSILGMN